MSTSQASLVRVSSSESHGGSHHLVHAPLTSEGSCFLTYQQRYVPVAVAGGLLSFALMFGTLAVFRQFAGAFGLLLGGPFAVLTALRWLDRLTVLGNERLEAEIRSRLAATEEESFVGVCRPENNRISVQAKETDDNVGLLKLTEEELLIRMEEGLLRIPRADVRQVQRRRVAALPLLRWIVVEYYVDTDIHEVLISCRQGESLRQHMKGSDELYQKIEDWYLAPLSEI